MKSEIQYVKIETLKPSEYNPRQATKKEIADLKESIKRFGFPDPVIVNCAPKRKNIIIGGHLRIHCAKEMGIAEVPVVYVDIPSIEREKELNVRLNKNTGSWDYALLANFDEDFLSSVGFDSREIDPIFCDVIVKRWEEYTGRKARIIK